MSAVLVIFHASTAIPIPCPKRIIQEVFSLLSNKYRKIILCITTLLRIVRTETPTLSFLLRQCPTSDLKASNSKIMCRILTIPVVPRSQGLVSRRVSLMSSISEPSPPPGVDSPRADLRACWEGVRGVELGHVRFELPEGVVVEDRVVVAILAALVSGVDVASLILRQWPQHPVGSGRIVFWASRIELCAFLTDKDMGKQGPVVLYTSRDDEFGLNAPVIALAAFQAEPLLTDNQALWRHVVETWDHNRRRDVHADVDAGVGRPVGVDELRDMAVLSRRLGCGLPIAGRQPLQLQVELQAWWGREIPLRTHDMLPGHKKKMEDWGARAPDSRNSHQAPLAAPACSPSTWGELAEIDGL
ncbi:hypothetical protein KC356_g265 [Hortaea werneckii]|nr:hypothetical protein KC356_g265 [Hortaea werneckii]